MKIAVYPFFYVTENLDAICILWGAFFIGVAIKLQRNLSVISCYLLIILGPFLLIPSKESLVFLSFLVFISLLMGGFKYRATLVISILFLVRPFFAPIFLVLMMIRRSKKPIKLIYIYLSFILIALVYLLFNTQAIEYINGYSIGYYEGALNAGSTDWGFIEDARNQTSIALLVATIFFRCLMPIWMLFLGGTSSIYFIWYVFIEFISIMTIYLFIKNFHYRYLKINTIALFLIAITPLSILLVTNAGSAVRYISILPLILETMAYNFKRKI
ncbi:hypothetical protein [Polynucleobacter corsicus]|uniref:hypothetical protein n=1 Tax=Polynucleobacter corsicus TaxID=2081042 RepID=UPI001BFD87ED|nr:hypothetical protein [Polynucleobacter corsicus]QWE18968.1 hypothetical protein C2747_01645 [Polynucleobacter corsicus]